MNNKFFNSVLEETIAHIKESLFKKGLEYSRNEDRMHNFKVGARMTGQIRERVLYNFALKHHISIEDIRKGIEEGELPSKDLVNEKFGDAINYLILEKASILHRIEEREASETDSRIGLSKGVAIPPNAVCNHENGTVIDAEGYSVCPDCGENC